MIFSRFVSTAIATCSAATLLTSHAAEPGSTIRQFPLSDVRLLDSPFKQAEKVDVDYIMELDEERLLSPFLREAGLHPKKESYGNWENTGLDGHSGGHYLSALAMMYASTGDARVKQRLDHMVSELKRVQKENNNGYIGGVPGGAKMWQEIKEGKIRASGFGLNDKWVPLYNIHKTYSGLRDAYLFAGNQDAKKMLIEFTDWMLDITDGLNDQQIQDMLRSEHGGLNEVFADVAKITGNDKYMKLARRFSHRAILDPLLRNDGRFLNGMHANTQIPKVIGFKRIADLENDQAWNDASRLFWENVTEKRSVSIGGNSVREHFHPEHDFRPMIDSEQGPETCNTYNMLKLTRMLFLADPQDRYMEFYERALYNHILSTQHPEKGGFVYFTSMRPGHYRVYSQPHTSFWCCVGSGLENHAKYGELIYAHDDEKLFVNLFIPSAVRWKQKGVVLTQKTQFPDEAKTAFEIKAAKPVTFTLNLRYPAWVRAGEFTASVNGEAVKVNAEPGQYVSIRRTWKNGDRVEVGLPMHVEAEQLPDRSNYFSFRYGPIVLAAKTTAEQTRGMFADDSRGGHVANDAKLPLNEMPVIVGEPATLADQIQPVAGKPLTFTIENVLSPRYKNLELTPFFRIHEARYVVYWRNESEKEVKGMQERLAAQEAENQKLAASTIDMVYCGEQQPESDHFIKSEGSQTGIHNGRHWRDARGWFSYVLKDKQREAKKLHVTYFGGDRGRNFKILINDTELATVQLDGSKGPEFFSVEYPIPSELVQNSDGTLVVKFQANPNSVAGGVFEVRLMK